ncbi:MAG: enolase C-terminal domain-like protein [Acidobacteriota bacterium]|nr:enolase C-terminal domain-like protein [Acidobacteriota bacterium]
MTDWNRRQWIATAAGITGLAGIEDMALAFDADAYGQNRSGTPKAAPPRSKMKISKFKATVVASPDFALLNSWNVHDTHFKRTILELGTDDGFTGIAEVAAGAMQDLEANRDKVLGRDPFEIEYFRRQFKTPNAFGAVEVACLDIIGKAINRRVVDLLGGAYREAQQFSAYIFFVMPTPNGPDYSTPESVARQFQEFNRKYGFTSCKFKGGVLHPDKEVEALRMMRAAMPNAKLRIDPNAAWSVETSVRVAKAIEPLGMEYYEDPTPGLDGMAAVRKQTKIPLATNMVVTKMEHIVPAIQKGSVDVVLLDNHYMGGLNNVRYWAAICEAMGWGCSGHSNNHLGISMAMMTHHMNCAISRVQYDADSHYPWTTEDIIKGPMLQFKDGKMALPDAPGLGVEIDPDKMAKLVENVKRFSTRHEQLKKWDPTYPLNDHRIRW